MAGQSNFKDERLQGATSDERQQLKFNEEFTGDGTVDRKGNIARKQKTPAPLIFGMLRIVLSL